MPTPESVAIREELAIARIQEAAVTLKERTGVKFDDVNLNVYMAPIERQAITLEQVAAILESLVVVLQEPLDPDAEGQELRARMAASQVDQEEGEDASTEQGKRRPSPRRKT